MNGSISIRRISVWGLLCAMLVIVAGCKGDSSAPPVTLSPLSDATAYVGQEFTMPISSPDGQDKNLEFSYRSCLSAGNVCTNEDLSGRADLRCAANECVFRWTPNSSDVGDHMFDFIVSDGKSTAVEMVRIAVQNSTHLPDRPVFREPMGKGTSHDITKNKCLKLNVVVEALDIAKVEISQGDPIIEGSTLEQTDAFKAIWSWCPTEDQINVTRHDLLLLANYGADEPVRKKFTIMLKTPPPKDCPGEAPVIEHTPQAKVSSLLDLDVEARITDDKGLKYEPLLYYSTVKPSDPPDPDTMNQLAMKTKSGTLQDGVWTVQIPNPIATTAKGTEATVYYMIVANDNDDPIGNCDHETISPPSATHVTTVANPGGHGGKILCEECSSDMQCGTTDKDLCAIVGTASKSYCLRGCNTNADCGDSKYACTPSPIKSVDGNSLRQCMPTSGSCVATDPTKCTDDKYEPNDTFDQAKLAKPLLEGRTSKLVMCPGETRLNDDWYPIMIPKTGKVMVLLEGQQSAELDIELVDMQAYSIAKSNDKGSNEIFEACVFPGTYYIHVFSTTNTRTTYAIEYTFTEDSSCIPSCSDDTYEPDDNATEARVAFMGKGNPYKRKGNVLCSNNEDWFELQLLKGDLIQATIKFNQTSAAGDLDLNLYYNNINQTPCVDKNDTKKCNSRNGQSTTSNEKLTWYAQETGYYYMVVKGHNGAFNKYDICIGLGQEDCPKL